MSDNATYDVETFAAVDDYIVEKVIGHDPILADALKRSNEAGLPAINVSPAQGKMLYLMARMQGARRILEVGTLAAYSTIWMARALPADGKLITLEFEQAHANVAGENVKSARLEKLIEIQVGPASDSMQKLIDLGEAPFDLIFIDADKEGYPVYFDLALKLSKPGTQIIADNVVRSGEVKDANCPDPRVQGVRQYMDKVSKSDKVTTTVIQTVGSKGYDGFALSVVL